MHACTVLYTLAVSYMEEACTLASYPQGYCVHMNHMLILCTKNAFLHSGQSAVIILFNFFCLIKTCPLVRVQIVRTLSFSSMACVCFSLHMPFKKET